MKLYYWKCDSYGEEAAVVSGSPEEAKEALRNSFPEYFWSSGASLFAEKAFADSHARVIKNMLDGNGYSH